MSEVDFNASRAEAARLLTAAGWRRVFVHGTLVGGVDPIGNMHIKDWAKIPPGHPDYGPDTPDTAEEAATWLAVNFVARAPEPEQIAPEIMEASDETHGTVETFPSGGVGDAPSMLAQRPDYADPDAGPLSDDAGIDAVDDEAILTALADAGTEARGLTPDEVAIIESQAADEAAEEVAGVVDSGDESTASGDDGSASDSDRDYAYDADYEEIREAVAAEASDFPELTVDAGEHPVEHERAYDTHGGVVYFGDDIHVARLAKLGRLAEIARERKALLQDGWTVSEFASLQNLIVRIERQEAPDDPEGRARFLAISERSRGMNTIDAYQNQREDELEQYAELLKGEDTREAGRTAIAAFNPEEGWPE